MCFLPISRFSVKNRQLHLKSFPKRPESFQNENKTGKIENLSLLIFPFLYLLRPVIADGRTTSELSDGFAYHLVI